MKTSFEHRLLATQVTDEPNNDKNMMWQREMDNKYKGKARETGRETPKGTFTKSPSGIANELKQHSEDFGQASSKLNGYINRKGRHLQGGERSRLYDAKQSLKNAYGVRDNQKTEALVEGPINSGKFGVGGDDPYLETGIGEHLEDEGVGTFKLKSAVRLVMTA